MSAIGNWIIDQEEAGKLVYVEGQGYVRPEDYASEYMKTSNYREEFDKAFCIHVRKEK